jgi:hypothetical protein
MNIQVFETAIRIDAAGRYSLNDLHAAAIKSGNATASHAPAQFLRNDSVKSFLSLIAMCNFAHRLSPIKVLQ